jgi:hypothetical protein
MLEVLKPEVAEGGKKPNETTQRPTCATCPYFGQPPNEDAAGSCRFNPPSVVAMPMPTRTGPPVVQTLGASPPVRPDFWCGKHPDFEAGRLDALAQLAQEVKHLRGIVESER